MSAFLGLQCHLCKTRFPAEAVYVCDRCLGPLEPVYDYGAIRLTREDIERRPKNLWRYRELLPIEGQPLTGFNSGFTPLVRAGRMVATHHDCVYEQFPQLFRDAAAVIRAKRKLYMRADRIVCISQDARRGLLQYYPVEAARTCVVHHGFTGLPRSAQAAEELDRKSVV